MDFSIDLNQVPVPCPRCGKPSTNIKSHSLPNHILFLFIFASYKYEGEVCCAECMRKQILLKHFTYNIIIGNILWLLIGFIPGIVKFASTFSKGHSQSVRRQIAAHISRETSLKEQPV